MKEKLKEAKRLQEKANHLLGLAKGMQERVEIMRETNSRIDKCLYISDKWTESEIDTCERGTKRLYYSYQKCLIKICEL